MEEYIPSGRDKNIGDPADRDQIYIKRKERQNSYVDCGAASPIQPIKYPSDSWSSSLLRMPMFTQDEMNMHISNFGKHIDPQSKAHTVPTSMKKAKIFLEDEYLNDLSVASNQVHFLLSPSVTIVPERMTLHTI